MLALPRRHRQNAKDLQALFASLRLRHDARAFENGLKTIAAQHGHMDQHVAFAAVRNDETVALGDVEPFDASGDFDQTGRSLLGEATRSLGNSGAILKTSSLTLAPTDACADLVAATETASRRRRRERSAMLRLIGDEDRASDSLTRRYQNGESGLAKSRGRSRTLWIGAVV